jgi:hypothetical protein
MRGLPIADSPRSFTAEVSALLRGLELGSELVDGGYVVEAGEVGVAGEGFAFFAVDQDFYFQNALGVGGDGVDQRGDG